MMVLLLGCSGGSPVVSSTLEPPDPPREWVSLTTQPCALDSEGYVDCWVSSAWTGPLVSGYFSFSEISTTGDFISSGRVSTIYAHELGGPTTTVACDGGAVFCQTPSTRWVDAGLQSGLLTNRALGVWDVGGVYAESDSGPLHALAGGTTPAAVSEENVVVTLMRGFEERLAIPHDRRVTHLAPGFFGLDDPYSACVLDVSGEVVCFGQRGLAEAEFLNPPYRDLDGDRGVACAVREVDDVIDCSDGTEHDLGPVRELQVYPYQQAVGDDLDYSQASLCVITTDNAIRCAGPHYPPDLLAQLEALPR